MRLLMWLNGLSGVLLIALSAAVYDYGQTPVGAQFAPKVEENVARLTDIKRVKELTVSILRAGNETVRAMNDFIKAGFDAFAICVLGFAAICIANAIYFFKHLRAAAGRPVKWLAWF